LSIDSSPSEDRLNVPEEPIEKSPEAAPSFLKSALVRLRDFLISTVVLLAIAYIFERVTSNESLSWALGIAIGAQNVLTNAVAGLNPLHLVQYWYEALSFISGGFAFLPDWLVTLAAPILRIVFGLLALCAVPIVVVREGTPFEWVLVFGCYVPTFLWLRHAMTNPDEVVSGWALLYAFLITLFFYWIVQLLLNLTLVVFRDVIATARLAVGGSLAFTALMWAVSKRSEHTVTERVLEIVTRKAEG
jgi:hypothetical protein